MVLHLLPLIRSAPISVLRMIQKGIKFETACDSDLRQQQGLLRGYGALQAAAQSFVLFTHFAREAPAELIEELPYVIQFCLPIVGIYSQQFLNSGWRNLKPIQR
jgi:hypothetical protein